ncbi:MAG: hypothetical protein H6855_03240 [Rhodospirillales bacterium]|nr:hypothetical protein [Rhodospirillales bacterium]MCB9973543.1 hypothetical protein [Rhodospirillales bacterium]
MRLIETHIEVINVEKSLALYQKLIPHRNCLRWADGNVGALVLEDGSAFGIWKKGHRGIHDGQGGNHVHFAFQIKLEDYTNYKNKILDAGLTPLEYEWDTGYKSVYFFDYDGHQGEFITADWIALNNL